MGIHLTKMDVAQNHVGDVLVSTMHFMADRYTPGGDAAYWETAVIPQKGDALVVYEDLWTRYPTREAAVAGHARAIAAVKTRQAAS